MSGPAAGRQINIPDEFQIGRAAPEDGRLGDDPELSRAHAKVTRNPQGQLVLEDLGSTNGTAVNGQRITGATVLKPGDTVQLGKTTLALQDEGGLQATALGGAAGGAAAGAAAAAAAAPPPPAPPTAPTQPLAAGGGPQSPGTPPPPPPPPGGGPAFGGGPGSGGSGGPPGGRPQPAGSSGGGGRKGLFIGLGALATVAAIVVAVLLLAGGGSDSNDEDDVRAAVTSFFENDCGALTDDYREELFGDAEGSPEEACEDAADDAEESDFDISDVSVDGDEAEAEVEVEDQDATFELAREDGDWKVDGIDAEVAMAGSGGATTPTPTETTPTPTPTPTETQEEDPRRTEAIATLQALITAVQDNDESVFCGLLSPRQAQRLVGGAGGDAAIARCVEVAADVDLGENVPDAIDVTGVRITGNQASVRLTTGERFTLVRRGGRYVIDSGLG
ncbi:MAG: FHA domain-containing protein [Thermoleophilaceae bacterium]